MNISTGLVRPTNATEVSERRNEPLSPTEREDSLLQSQLHSEDGLESAVLLQLEDSRLDFKLQSKSASNVIIATNSAVSVIVVVPCRRD